MSFGLGKKCECLDEDNGAVERREEYAPNKDPRADSVDTPCSRRRSWRSRGRINWRMKQRWPMDHSFNLSIVSVPPRLGKLQKTHPLLLQGLLQTSRCCQASIRHALEQERLAEHKLLQRVHAAVELLDVARPRPPLLVRLLVDAVSTPSHAFRARLRAGASQLGPAAVLAGPSGGRRVGAVKGVAILALRIRGGSGAVGVRVSAPFLAGAGFWGRCMVHGTWGSGS